ncbi:anti-sigma regulatory factor (Ser/Thr protein kinase) [Streptomyces sp. V3I8]|uniref:ATP-binding protein n=1 Tax=Streptomyces sp. V3I8 TaxID=3042279 RepID=UPI00277D4051|nr:ATP-binding protein [Streptomyces sp. V3I8]MDQ1035279.1 anti-sigma regulatory factor (Ser/Thr protein kinase) [Streptomyces sp. V3I8]
MESVPGVEDHARPGDRPIRETLALNGEGSVIAEARHRAAAFLTRAQTEHGVQVSARALDVTQLVVSELVTNVHKYAPGPALMELRITDSLVEVSVWDSDPARPTARTTDAGRIGQHGLEIVKAVSESLEIVQEPVGKRVTARIILSDPPGELSSRTPA